MLVPEGSSYGWRMRQAYVASCDGRMMVAVDYDGDDERLRQHSTLQDY